MRFVKHNEGDHDGDDNNYDKFRELQNGACRIKSDKSFVRDLYPKTYNPKHEFFPLSLHVYYAMIHSTLC